MNELVKRFFSINVLKTHRHHDKLLHLQLPLLRAGLGQYRGGPGQARGEPHGLLSLLLGLLLLLPRIPLGARADPEVHHLPANDLGLRVLQGEDDFDRAPVYAANVGAEAHELEEVSAVGGPDLGLLKGHDQGVAAAGLVLFVPGSLMLGSD